MVRGERMGEGVVRALGAVQSSTAVGLKPSLKCLGRALKISFSRLAQPLQPLAQYKGARSGG